MNTLKDKVIVITGASRGIGRAMALRFAQDGANIVIAAKTEKPHPTLAGTIHSVAEEVVKAGGKALPFKVDVREDKSVEALMEKTIETFGKIDVLVNNASAISLTSTLETSMKRLDLMFAVNVRATFACSKAAIPYLKHGKNPHILTLSPPLNLNPKWFSDHLAYTMSKYGMSMCTLGLSEEFKPHGIAANSLWPKTAIATSAVEVHFPEDIYKATRKPDIMADAAYHIITQDSRLCTGNFFIDENVVTAAGTKDLSHYEFCPGTPLYMDLFLENES